jgi:hypothetical protein
VRGHVRKAMPQRPAAANCHASRRAGVAFEGGTTYRPRSVSSLLMRLRAMTVDVCVYVLVGLWLGLWVCMGGREVGEVKWEFCSRPGLALDP